MRKFFQLAAIVASFLVLQFTTEGQGVFVDQINVFGKYNSSYILTYSNVLLLRITDMDEKRVQKVLTNLRKAASMMMSSGISLDETLTYAAF